MEEGVVRMAAQMFAEVARLEALKARVEGMKAENAERANNGYSAAYTEPDFRGIANVMEAIAGRLAAM